MDCNGDKIEVEKDVWNGIVVTMFQDYFDEINAVWARDGGTPATSLVTWMKERIAAEKKG